MLNFKKNYKCRKKGKYYIEMVESLLNNLRTDKVNRIDVSFEIPEKYNYIFCNIIIYNNKKNFR
jgi:hypothetical protein